MHINFAAYPFHTRRPHDRFAQWTHVESVETIFISSIMPGKVNPTQCEAIVMISIQVIGDDSAVAFAGSQGNFELNAMRPIIINNYLHSCQILADGCEKFRIYSVEWNCPGLMDKWFRQLSELRTRLDCGTRGLSEVV